jgi:CHASE3 domain sensor protein
MFRNWVLQNFPFLENDFDALTDYELFCKIFEYIKNYQKEFDRIEKEIKDFEEYLSTIDIEKTIHEILDVELPELSEEILAEVDIKLANLNEEISNTIEELNNNINNELDLINNEINSIKQGNINVYNPTNGENDTLNNTLQDIVGMIINTIPTAITCYEFDNLELSATEFDNYEITALEFDLNAKEILV